MAAGMVTIKQVRLKTVVRPLRMTFATALGSKTVATSVLVEIVLSDGRRAVGEVPTSFVLKHETVSAIRRIITQAAGKLVGLAVGSSGGSSGDTKLNCPNTMKRAIECYVPGTGAIECYVPGTEVVELFRKRYPAFHMTLSGLEVALFRAGLVANGLTEYAFWSWMGRASNLLLAQCGTGSKHGHAKGGVTVPPAAFAPLVAKGTLDAWVPKRHPPYDPPSRARGKKVGRSIRTDITIPFLPEAGMLKAWMARAIRTGFTVYKVKVSGDVPADMRFVTRVRALLADGVEGYSIRLDGNQGYSARTCLEMIERLDRANIRAEVFEQPLPKDDFRGLAQLRGRSPIPIILDETVFSAAECQRAIDRGLGDGVNIKIAKSGIAESLAILKLAKSAGMKLMIGCMTETMVGLSAGIYLAAGTGAFDYIDLDSIHLIQHKKKYGDIILDRDEYRLVAQ
jgi:L-alanine-DL-glutamate epimerase-like enolase superfamily enzyme